LVQLFTALGFATGFSLEESLRAVDEISHAGLERPPIDNANPYVVKSPWFADVIAQALHDRKIVVYAALLPVRGLFEAAESRRRVYREARNRGMDTVLQAGSLWQTDDPSAQEQVLAAQLYKTIFPLLEHEVPVYLMAFPRLVTDPDYLFRRLEPLMSDHGVSLSEFLRAHSTAARPELVHDFSAPGS
jgi:hypothetical protein